MTYTLLLILHAWGTDASHYGFFEIALERNISAQQCNSFAASGRNGECLAPEKAEAFLREHQCEPLSPHYHYRCTRS